MDGWRPGLKIRKRKGRLMDVNQRIRELKEKGLSNAKIAAALTVEGYKAKGGTPFTADTVSDRLYRMKQKDRQAAGASDTTETSDQLPVLTVVRREPEKPVESKAVQLTVVPKSSHKSNTPETPLIPKDLQTLIALMVTDEVNARMEGQKYPICQTEEPPLPKRTATSEKGKPKAPGERVKIAGTIDSVLGAKFDEWRLEKGITLSRALDIALWHFLGKPKLSFEKDTEEKGK